MRVALISPYALSVHGGVQEQVISMSRTLCARGHEVLVIAPDEADTATYDTPAPVRRFGSLVTLPANGSRAPLALSRRARRAAYNAVVAFAPDVVHLHEPFAPTLGYTVLARHRWPLVATFHRSGGFAPLRYLRCVFGTVVRRIDLAVAVSASAATTALNDFACDTEVLFNGIDVERLRRAPRRAPDQVTVVTVGRLEERKGVTTLLSAVLAHNATSPEAPWHLEIVGAGPERGALERLANGDRRIRFHGALADKEKNELLRSASVIVCPALRGESFGIVVLEAMACEVPVVVSDIDGYRQAAGGRGLLSAPGDASALEATILRALEVNDSWVASAATYAETWSMDALVTRYETLYHEAIGHFVSR